MTATYRREYEDQLFLDSETAPGGILVYYADGNEEIIHVNRYLIDLFECDSVDDFLAYTKGSFRNFVYSDDIEAAEGSIWGQVPKQNNYDHLYYRIKTKTGRLVNVEDFGRLVENTRSRPVFHVFIAEMKQGYSVDWLTGLPDMARFHKLSRFAAHAIEEQGKRPAVIALDLVGLKGFNAQYGRDEGDKLLCAFADTLRTYFGSEACSRFAEDHFYAFTVEEGLPEKLRDLFETFKKANGGRVLPVRAGAYACRPGEDIVTIGTDRAKIACDLDRKTWESHVVWFNDDMRDAEKLRVHVLESLGQAIAEKWIRPYYQAIVRSSTGNLCCEEALARWNDPEYGMLQTWQFIPVLEEAGLLYKLDMHMVDCVLEDILEKRSLGVPVVPVSINLSQRDFRQIDVADTLAEKADAAGVPRRYLNIEVTESAALNDSELLKMQIQTLHEAGFQVWLDDFGSGYSTLNTVRDYDFDVIKLDMNFTKSLGDSEKAREVVSGVVHTAERMGVTTLAEGVESEEQAVYLEKVGCGMVQGFYHSYALPLEIVIERFQTGIGKEREIPDEQSYWNIIGTVSLIDAANQGTDKIDGAPPSEYPVGIIECRSGLWRVLRANEPYRVFLDDTGILPLSSSTLKANPIEAGLDAEFLDAVDRCIVSGTWELVAGRIENNTNTQFYIRPIASTELARAFMVVALPTSLGTALGIFGDVPVGYTVLRLVRGNEHEDLNDLEFVYANPLYHQLCGIEGESLTGRSFAAQHPHASDTWFARCSHVVESGEQIHEVIYSHELHHWLSFNLAPAKIKDCCVLAFLVVDDERREREEMLTNLDTSELIINLTDAFDSEDDFERAMNGALEALSRNVRPDHLYVLEQGNVLGNHAFEWCAEGKQPRLDIVKGLNSPAIDSLSAMLDQQSMLLIPSAEELRAIDEQLAARFEQQGIRNALIMPLNDSGELVGYLGAENYALDSSIDTTRLIETFSRFIATRISNNQLFEKLEWAGMNDSLTGLLNRRGVDLATEERLGGNPDEPFVLALLDIDDFKVTNDLYGHAVGDEALRTLARFTKRAFGAESIIGRNGGDELVILLFGKTAEEADQLFEAYSNADKSFEFEGKRYPMSTSIGYVSYPDPADSITAAYAHADSALYAVKLAGKSSFARYSASMETQFRTQLGFTPRDIAENVPAAIMIHRAGGDGEILFANNELIEMFECDDLEDFMNYTGGTFRNIVHPDDAVHVYEEAVRQVGLDEIGKKNFIDFRIIGKKGTVKHVADNGRLVNIDGIGKAFYVLMVDQDEHAMRQSRS